MNSAAEHRPFWRSPTAILLAGSFCVLMAFGLRASFGLFLNPMNLELEWGVATFSFAIALQNILWGAFQPFASAAAEKWGTGRVIVFGGLLYACGLYLMAAPSDPFMFHMSAGVMVGMAQSACALAVVLGAVGRAMPAEKRSWGLGIVTAAGAAGQFTVVPVGQVFISSFGWSTAYLLMALLAMVIVLCAVPLKGRADALPASGQQDGSLSLTEALREASVHRGYWLLTLGFFVCGFHVAFVGFHLPKYLTDAGLPAETGAWSLALIGIFNVIGSYYAGVLGDKRRKKYLLSYLYLARSVVILVFILTPVSTLSVILFSSALGVLWLSTVPLTSGLVAQIFGTRYMGTLFSIVFFSHQIGSFLGVWLGGYLYDMSGTYMPVWWAGGALGVIAAALHWPINDRQVVRLAPAE